ncbi:MAG: ATPase [Rhodospirillales bacterium]|nr:ATPase [Rhodospirillales bacterium]
MNDLTIKPAPVRHSIHVKASAERAFEVFTKGMTRWWLPSHKIGATPFKDVVMEPRAGGRWFERAEDGVECQWGQVAIWEPPSRLVLLWQISAQWTFDPMLKTEVEIRFTEENGGTRVELEHRGLDAYGEQAETLRATFASPGGWPGLLGAFEKGI